MKPIQIPQKGIEIIDGYEGLVGLRDGKYYPYHGAADEPLALTIGRGHLLTQADKACGAFENGLTLAEVETLFEEDIQPRAEVLSAIMGHHTDDQFAGALSSYYNCPSMWAATPAHSHREGRFKDVASAMLLYIISDGRHRLGLWRRRMTEALCYLTGEVIIAADVRSEAFLVKQLSRLIPVVRPAGLE